MPPPIPPDVTDAQKRVYGQDVQDLANVGVKPFSAEAVPYWANWTRQDLILVIHLLAHLNRHLGKIVSLLQTIVFLIILVLINMIF
jgi:hypothetical protein